MAYEPDKRLHHWQVELTGTGAHEDLSALLYFHGVTYYTLEVEGYVFPGELPDYPGPGEVPAQQPYRAASAGCVVDAGAGRRCYAHALRRSHGQQKARPSPDAAGGQGRPAVMFAETIYSDREEWEKWNERLRAAEDPPDGLVLMVSWDAGDGRVGQLNVWEAPDKIADAYIERVQHVIAELGEPKDKPQRHGPPLTFYVRPGV